MRESERIRLNDKAARLVMKWVKSRDGVWEIVDPNSLRVEFSGYAAAPDRGRPHIYFNPTDHLEHAWELIAQLQLPPNVPKKMAMFNTFMKFKWDSSVPIWMMGQRELATRITHAAVQTIVELHLQHVERTSPK